ncbi:MAG: hypothetical protein GXX78_15825 [Bacteroidales bacterium]|nr:hypothetical protein [Bacteroidales bacterium]
MKWENVISLLVIALGLSGCVVYSFYPLYSEKDLFANDYLLGNYYSFEDSTSWDFTYLKKKIKNNEITDSTGYKLKVVENKDSSLTSYFIVHLIKIDGVLIADFLLDDYAKKKDVRLFDFHIIPVHTFAKVIIEKDKITFKWFNGEWLKKLIEENRLRIRHENNGEFILLTAKSAELQKFLKKYLHSEDAFKDGLEVEFAKQNK